MEKKDRELENYREVNEDILRKRRRRRRGEVKNRTVVKRTIKRRGKVIEVEEENDK